MHRSHLGLTLGLLALTLAPALVGCNNALETGNRLECVGGSCSSSCDNEGTSVSCEVLCQDGTTCDARCNAGQDCRFTCAPGARCDFDCTAGSCSVSGTGAERCSCVGTCPGTCGGTAGFDDAGVPAMGSDAGGGGGGTDCLDLCGEPTDPGYAACVAACA